jgi:hypothetical protein
MNTTISQNDSTPAVQLTKKEGGITKSKKKVCTPRATPRPYKNLSTERLESTIFTLKERVEVTDNRLQTYNIRLKKLNTESQARQKAAETQNTENILEDL